MKMDSLSQDQLALLEDMEEGNLKSVVFAKDSLEKHSESKLKIYVKVLEIRKQFRSDYKFIRSKAVLENPRDPFSRKIEIDCLVACNKWDRLDLSKIKEDQINILDYFKFFFPSSPDQTKVGLVTFQNGIQNSFSDFETMGDLIKGKINGISSFGHKPLCIGFYNNTTALKAGIYDDFKRLDDEWHLNANSILTIRQFIYTLANPEASIGLNCLLPKKVLWTHIAHSEGGLIAKEIITTDHRYRLGQIEKDFIKEHLVVSTYGAVAPVPNVIFGALNTYSSQDVTLRYIWKYLKEKRPGTLKLDNTKKRSYETFSEKCGYLLENDYPYDYTNHEHKLTFRIVKCLKLSFVDTVTIKRDHDFAGDTYQQALKTNLEELQGKHKFYEN